MTEIVSVASNLIYIHEPYINIYPSPRKYFSTTVKFVHLPSPFNCVAEYWKLPYGFAERFTIIRWAVGQHSVTEKLTSILFGSGQPISLHYSVTFTISFADTILVGALRVMSELLVLAITWWYTYQSYHIMEDSLKLGTSILSLLVYNGKPPPSSVVLLTNAVIKPSGSVYFV